MTSQDIYNRYKLGIPGAFETVGEADEAILAAIQEALNVNATHLAELEKEKEQAEVDLFKNQLDRASEWAKQQHRIIELEKENKELREGHYANVTDAYDAGHEDGHYGAHGVILHKYLDSHDYYTKTFNNEK